MESLVTSVVNAMGSTAVGGGIVQFLHRLWWHLASILGWAWFISVSVGGTALTVMADFFAYVGLPDGLQRVPIHVREWIVERPETSAAASFILLVALLVAMRPWGDQWTDEPMSPAGASAVLAALYLAEVAGNGILWSVVLCVGLLLIIKWFAHAPQAVAYAVLSPFLTLLYTPVALGTLLVSPVRMARRDLPVAQGAEGARA